MKKISFETAVAVFVCVVLGLLLLIGVLLISMEMFKWACVFLVPCSFGLYFMVGMAIYNDKSK